MQQVDFAYSDRLVLKHINLRVPQGATLGIVGPNGGGKTTLIRLLVGLLKPTRGQILVAGMSVQQACRCGNVIGYLPQRPELNGQMPLSARQLLQLCGHCDANRREHLLDCVGLRDIADEPIGSFSGGQLQRLLIARALVASPKLLLLDEPTTGIDSTSREQFIQLLRTLRSELKLTLIMSSHDLHTVNDLCDEVACVNLTLHLHDRPLRHSSDNAQFCSI